MPKRRSHHIPASASGGARLTPKPTEPPQLRPTAPPAPTPYPAPLPARVNLRTHGETSISTERVAMSVRTRFNPLRGLTADRLVSYLEQFDLGFFRNAALVWDRWERRDYTLRAVVPKRKKAVARHGFEILTVDNLPANQQALAAQQADALTYFYNHLTATDALRPDQQGGLALLVRQMRDADAKYYAVHEIVWQPRAEGITAQFVFCPLWWFEGTIGKLRYMDSEFQVYGRDMRPGEWLVTCGDGLMEACSVAAMLKQLSLTDWLNFNERYGQPFLDAATSASPGSEDWDRLVQYVQNFGADGGGVRSQSATISMLEPKNSASETYERMVANMDRAMTIIWRGGDLGTSSGKNHTGASLQQDESDILEADDAVSTEETLATQVSRWVIRHQFGPDAPVLAYLKFKRQDKQNVELDLKIDQFLLQAGAPLEVKNLLERYGRPLPAAGETLLKSPAPAASAPINHSTPQA
jgi:phage gp29-like protein